MDKYNKLRELNDNDIGDFTLDGKKCIGKVVKIYNTKNIKMILLIGNTVFKFNCYLYGVQKNLDDIYLSKIKEILLDSEDVENNYRLLEVECKKFNKEGLLGVFIKKLNNELPQCNEEEGVNWNIYK